MVSRVTSPNPHPARIIFYWNLNLDTPLCFDPGNVIWIERMDRYNEGLLIVCIKAGRGESRSDLVSCLPERRIDVGPDNGHHPISFN
jgi:hypothetical protein